MVLSVEEARTIFRQFQDEYIDKEPFASYYWTGALHLIALKDGVPQTDNEHDFVTGCFFSVVYWKFEKHPSLRIPVSFGGIRVQGEIVAVTKKEWLAGENPRPGIPARR